MDAEIPDAVIRRRGGRVFSHLIHRLAALLVFSFFLFPTIATAEPFISEFQAANADGIRDEDGDRSDWIEIHNPESAAVSLEGMSLTNDPQQPKKWPLPDITLAPNESRLIWASGKNRANHTNFRLGASGEFLALYDKDGVTPLSLFNPYPSQPDNRSYGMGKPVLVEHAISAETTCRWLVPDGEVVDWEQPAFDDSAWSTAASAIGYDQQADGVDFNPFIASDGNIESEIYGNNSTCYVRIPFSVTDAAGVVAMKLRIRHDDGCAVFLNGTRLDTDTNAPEILRHDSTATERRADVDAVVPLEIDLTAQLPLLVEGGNVLSIQLLNSNKYSPDALLVTELDLVRQNPVAATATGFYAVPTPGAYNMVAPVEGFVSAPAFSRTRGFFTDPISVALTSPGAVIRYTVDGSMPTETHGTVYTSPVSIGTTTALHAVAYREGWGTSPVVSHTYVFPEQVVSQQERDGLPATWGWAYDPDTELYEPSEPITADYAMDPGVTQSAKYGPQMLDSLKNTLPVVSLSAPAEAIFGVNGIYANGREDRSEVPVSIEYFDAAKGQAFYENAGLRIHGGNAAGEHRKKPFRVYFRKSYGGTGELDFPLYPDSPVAKFDKLQLRPGGHDGWAVPFGTEDTSLARHATYLRDRFLRQTQLDMGRLAARGSYVHLYLNGLYWGVYDLHEVPDHDFYSEHAGGKKEEWDALEHTEEDGKSFHVVDGDGGAMDHALALCRPASALEDDARYEQVARLVDVDDFIDYLIVQMWAANNDWVGPVFLGTGSQNASRFPNKNWQTGIRSHTAAPGKFTWNVWDAEISMGSGISPYVDEMRVLDYDHTRVGQPFSESGIYMVPGPPAELYHALQLNRRFRTRFADRLQKHLFNGGELTTARSLARITALQNQLHGPLVAESARWGDVNRGDTEDVTFLRDEHWLDEVEWLKNSYIPQRAGILLGQFHSIGIWPQLAAPVVSPAGGTIPAGGDVTITSPTPATIYYTTDGSDPMTDAATAKSVLVAENATARFKVPAAGYSSEAWKEIAEPSDIATWGSGAGGFGFDAQGAFSGNYSTSLKSAMKGVNSTVYLRVPFSLMPQQRAAITRIGLNLRYDDGVRVYLNGGSVPVLALNAPAGAPASNDAATAERPDHEVLATRFFDLTAHLEKLRDGNNVLAIQGLNLTAGDADFLLGAELVAYHDTPRAPSPAAMVYDGGVTLDQAARVNARSFDGNEWSPLAVADFTTTGNPPPKLVVTEIYYNPTLRPGESGAGVTAQQFEFMEIMNAGQQTASLAGCHFTSGIKFTFTGVFDVAPGQRFLLVSNGAAFARRNAGIPFAGVFEEDSNLSNSGERLAMEDASGRVLFDFSYSDSSPWPKSPDGGGTSLVLIDPADMPDPSLPHNWRASLTAGGTPGGTESDSYAAWASRHSVSGGPSSLTGLLPNLLNYALAPMPGTDRRFAITTENLMVGNVVSRYLVVRFTRNTLAEDVRVRPEYSTDLIHWSAMPDQVAAPVNNSDATQAAGYRLPVPLDAVKDRVFVRISGVLR